jgi:hypothetical protein
LPALAKAISIMGATGPMKSGVSPDALTPTYYDDTGFSAIYDKNRNSSFHGFFGPCFVAK